MSVHAKLQEARVKLQRKPLKKSGHNKFAGYEYFELGDFLPTIQEIFNEVGLCGTITFDREMAHLFITEVESNQMVTFSCPMERASLKGCHEVQNLGASMTYIRRYLWVNALEIVEHDALDAITGKGVIKPTRNDAYQPEGEELTFINGVLQEVLACENDIPVAANILYKSNLDNDQITWIWDKLGNKSAFRAAIKKYHKEQQ